MTWVFANKVSDICQAKGGDTTGIALLITSLMQMLAKTLVLHEA